LKIGDLKLKPHPFSKLEKGIEDRGVLVSKGEATIREKM
jgi:hypothetical protein